MKIEFTQKLCEPQHVSYEIAALWKDGWLLAHTVPVHAQIPYYYSVDESSILVSSYVLLLFERVTQDSEPDRVMAMRG